MNGLTLAAAPMLPWAAIAAFAAVAVLVLLYGALRRARGITWRVLAVAALLLILIDPSLVEEQRQPQHDEHRETGSCAGEQNGAGPDHEADRQHAIHIETIHQPAGQQGQQIIRLQPFAGIELHSFLAAIQLVEAARDQRRPARLVAGAAAAPVLGVEVFVE